MTVAVTKLSQVENRRSRSATKRIGLLAGGAAVLALAWNLTGAAQNTNQNASFHNAPAESKAQKNPYEGQHSASAKTAYQQSCAQCHGANGEGTGNIPPLATGRAQSATDGELFWYITKGDVNNGMPSWQQLPDQQRWEIVNYLRVLGSLKPGSPRIALSADEAVDTGKNAPPPKAPFTDYRYERP